MHTNLRRWVLTVGLCVDHEDLSAAAHIDFVHRPLLQHTAVPLRARVSCVLLPVEVSSFSLHLLAYLHHLHRGVHRPMSKSRHSRGRNHLVAKGAQKTVDGLFLQQSEEDLEFEVMDRVYAFSGTLPSVLHYHATD